jgi:hypothetical protein
MADIRVERRGPRIWPWILGLLLLALVIWLAVTYFGTDEVEQVRDEAAGAVESVAEP